MDNVAFRPLLRTQADVEALWRRLMSPLGFRSCSLWLVVVEDQRPRPQVVEFSDTPRTPAAHTSERLAVALENLAGDPNISFAFLRSRPGAGPVTAYDLSWAKTLYDVGRRVGVPLLVTHLAHNHDVVPITADDLLAAPA
jgi:hypothetical protein